MSDIREIRGVRLLRPKVLTLTCDVDEAHPHIVTIRSENVKEVILKNGERVLYGYCSTHRGYFRL